MKINKRLLITVLFSIALTTSACNDTKTATEPANIHVLLSEPNNEDPASFTIDQIFQDTATSFQNSNPLIKVTIDHAPKDKTAPKEIIKLLKSNEAPDIIPFDVSFLGIAEKEGVLLDLNKLQQMPGSKKMDINQKLLDTITINGEILVMPIAANPQAVLYNKKIFDAKSIPYPQGDWTWEQFRDISKKNKTVNSTQGSILPYDFSTFNILLASYGQSVISPEGNNTGLGYLDSQEAIRIIQWMNAYYHDDIDKLTPQTGYDAGSQFYASQTGMIVSSLGYYNYFKAALGDTLGVAPLPHFEGSKRANPLYLQGFGITKKSKYPDAAWKFIQYLTLTKQEDSIKLADYYLTTSETMAEAVGQNSDPIKRIFADEMNYAVKPSGYYNPLLFEAWNEGLNTQFQKLLTANDKVIPAKLHELAMKLDQEMNRLKKAEDQSTDNPIPAE